MQLEYIPCSESAPLTMATIPAGLHPFLYHRAFPVKPGTREPEVKRWQIPRKTRHGREKLLMHYITKFPNSSVGIQLGWDYATLSHVAVIDIDRPDQLSEYLVSVLEKRPWVVRTRRGMHCYGTPPENMRYAEKGYPWGEYLTGGNFVMAPGACTGSFNCWRVGR